MASPSAVLATVPPVLDGIVAAAFESSSNLGPSLAHLVDHLLDLLALFGGDRIMVKSGLQVLVEALTALLWRPGLNGM